MSELINARNGRNDLRWQLLTTVSALALLLPVYGIRQAQAADGDADHPSVWIELGGQFESMSGSDERLAPPFISGITAMGYASPTDFEHMPRSSFGGDGKISFTPNGTDWIFSAAVRYGRSVSIKHQHQEHDLIHSMLPTYYYHPSGYVKHQVANAADFADTLVNNREAHAIVDFQAGKDVGLGKFGAHGVSALTAGVRFAQFASRSHIELKSDQDLGFGGYQTSFYNRALQTHYKSYAAELDAARSFHGVGPSLSWNASALVSGGEDASKITFDWGANVAVLFGRQKASIHHQSAYAYKTKQNFSFSHAAPANIVRTSHYAPPDQNRVRSVVVPNIGGFAGLSFRYADAKISMGYRADFFLGAMDGGIDAAKKENRGFYGPFASVSIGLGG